jgi:hypothetical protein
VEIEQCKQLHKKKAPRYIALHPSLAPLTRLICKVERFYFPHTFKSPLLYVALVSITKNPTKSSEKNLLQRHETGS